MSDPGFERPPGFEALMDLSFTRFITVNVIKFIYVLGILGLCLSWIGMVIAGFSQGFGGGLIAMVIGSVFFVIAVLMLRVQLELIVVIFRIGENTAAIARSSSPGGPTGGFPVIPTQPQ